MITRILEFLKQNYQLILKVLFGLYILYYLYYFLTPNVRMSAEQRGKLDSLSIQIKELKEDNLRLEQKISKFDGEIDKVDRNITNIKAQKTIIKEIYHEKISSVDRLTIAEIDSFFASRYR